MTRTNHEPMYTGFRPKYSDKGARSIGPNVVVLDLVMLGRVTEAYCIPIAKPRRYMDRPTVPSSVVELNAMTMSGAAEE